MARTHTAMTVKGAVDLYLSGGYLLISASDDNGIHEVVLGDYYSHSTGNKRTNTPKKIVVVRQVGDGEVTATDYN